MTEPEHLDLTDRGTLNALLQRHDFSTKKGLGQHLLVSPSALAAIVRACALEEGLPILEIGPGIGTVTRALAEAGAEVTAIELDPRAVAVLQETVGAFPRVRVLQGDIMETDLPALLGDRCWTAVGNLPYYITTPVIGRVLEVAGHFRRAVFMVQREVADRMQAAPGSKIYGSLSVFVQVYAEVTRVAKVLRGGFLPPPTVDSTVIQLAIRPQPLVPAALQPVFFPLVRAAFGTRRKTLENALGVGGIFGGDRAAIADVLHVAGIDPGRRGETLSIAEFLSIAEEVARRL